jgi:hypothetical protein
MTSYQAAELRRLFQRYRDVVIAESLNGFLDAVVLASAEVELYRFISQIAIAEAADEYGGDPDEYDGYDGS